jgi:hypothetical protein
VQSVPPFSGLEAGYLCIDVGGESAQGAAMNLNRVKLARLEERYENPLKQWTHFDTFDLLAWRPACYRVEK